MLHVQITIDTSSLCYLWSLHFQGVFNLINQCLTEDEVSFKKNTVYVCIFKIDGLSPKISLETCGSEKITS